MPRPLDAPLVDDPHAYVGRPSVSPALAALVSAGLVRKEHRILDLGCGRGTDLVALAELGFRRLEGLDKNKASLRAARALERRRTGRADVTWRLGSLDALLALDAGAYDWCVDTFLLNNLDEEHEPEYLRRVARVLRPGGRFLVQHKVRPRAWIRDGRPALRAPGFTSGPPLLTHYAEHGRRGERSYEAAVVEVLTRRAGR